jgi:HCOMODA/2-hydroxy-3-carboxy-muconic semialdehyde decarboxylase
MASTLALAGFLPGSAFADGEPDLTHYRRPVLDVVIANRILANQGVVDAYGHVSLRDPDDSTCFLLSRSRSPELVEPADILAFHLDGTPVEPTQVPLYIERFIHAAIYQARPDVNAIVHAHAIDVLPFTISKTPLQPVIENAGVIGLHVPVWDSRTHFGSTDLFVSSLAMGEDLARTLGKDHVVLMRGHGFAAAGRSLIEVLRMAIYLPQDARVLSEALKLGPVMPLTQGEIDKISDIAPDAPALRRAWQYWAQRAGCGDLLQAESTLRQTK